MLFLSGSLWVFSVWLLEYTSSPNFIHSWSFGGLGWCSQYTLNSGGKRGGIDLLHKQGIDTSQKLGNESTFSEGGLTRVRQEEQTAAHAWVIQHSGALGHGGVGGAIQAACRHQTGSNSCWVSFKKVLHAYDLWPWVLHPGVWKVCHCKIKSQIHSSVPSDRESDERCTQPQIPPRWSS